jgi:predicted Zn-dependent protease with MMP-like domain
MDDQEFGKLIDKAVNEIPEEFLKQIENVSIVIEDYPTRFQLEKIQAIGRGFMLLGLYEGVPKTKRGRYGIGGTLPDKITIFKMPMISIAKSYNDLVKIVKNTVWHEIAHHFGMDEKAVREAERKRIERLSKKVLLDAKKAS